MLTAVSAADPRFQHDGSGGRSVVDDAERHSWRIYCLDRTSGQILWQRTVRDSVPRVKRHVRSSHANATPATDGRYVVAFFGSEGLYVYDVEGNLVWERDLGVLDAGYVGLPDYQWETASSPIIYRNLVIVQCDSRSDSLVAAFDLSSGNEVWRSTVFEGGLISTDLVEYGATFEPDGQAIYFVRSTIPWGQRSAGTTFIYTSRLTPAGWSLPEVAPFSGHSRDRDPFVTTDGNRLFFTSDRPVGGQPQGDFDIWMVEARVATAGVFGFTWPRLTLSGDSALENNAVS